MTLQTGRIVLEDLGFAITLPDGWSSIPMGADDIQGIIATLDPDDPMVSLLLGQIGQVADGVKLVAFDVSPESLASGFGANMNVIAAPATSLTLETLASFSGAQIKTYLQEGQKVAIKSITIPAGPAVTMSYKVFFPTAVGTQVNAQGKQLYIKSKTNTLVLTFTCNGETPGACPANTEAMIKSIELL